MAVALVTGATRGLGYAVAEALARSGTTVVVAGRDGDRAREVAAGLPAPDEGPAWVQLDVTSVASIRQAAESVGARFGRLDLLVNNAGVLPEATAAPAGPGDVEVFRTTFETNVFGAVAVTDAFLPLLQQSGAGRVVNVSSTMGSLSDQLDPQSPYFDLDVPAYRASKAALNSVTIGLAKSLTATGVTAVAVCPGFVQTELTPANREYAPLTAAQAAEFVVGVALDTEVRSGSFVSVSGVVPW